MSPRHEAAGIESVLHTNLNASEVVTGSHDKTDRPDPLLIYAATAKWCGYVKVQSLTQPSALKTFLNVTAQARSKAAVNTDSTNSPLVCLALWMAFIPNYLSTVFLDSFCSASLQRGAPTGESGRVSGELVKAVLQEGENLEVGQEGRDERLSACIPSKGLLQRAQGKGEMQYISTFTPDVINRAVWQTAAIALFLRVSQIKLLQKSILSFRLSCPCPLNSGPGLAAVQVLGKDTCKCFPLTASLENRTVPIYFS